MRLKELMKKPLYRILSAGKESDHKSTEERGFVSF